jgi:hypothetical protein
LLLSDPPGIVRAQSTSEPVGLGDLSDMSRPYRHVGGSGSRPALELAVADYGGAVLDRPIEVLQADVGLLDSWSSLGYPLSARPTNILDRSLFIPRSWHTVCVKLYAVARLV